jgi:hypothetical protein
MATSANPVTPMAPLQPRQNRSLNAVAIIDHDSEFFCSTTELASVLDQ